MALPLAPVQFEKNEYAGTFIFLLTFRGSSTVERLAVNELVVGSNPTPGANQIQNTLLGVFGLILSLGWIRTGRGSGKREFSRDGAHEPMGSWEQICCIADLRRSIPRPPEPIKWYVNLTKKNLLYSISIEGVVVCGEDLCFFGKTLKSGGDSMAHEILLIQGLEYLLFSFLTENNPENFKSGKDIHAKYGHKYHNLYKICKKSMLI